MEPLYFAAAADLPEVALDPAKNIFKVAGRSMPEDAIRFYNPILAWFTLYSEEPNPLTAFAIQLEYFNTSSSKPLMEILTLLETLCAKGSEVQIDWYYDEDDEDMLDAGVELSEIIKIPFKFHQIEV
jgi:hypothetical protein